MIPKAKGIDNIGNSCYLNCVIQALISSPQLNSFICNASDRSKWTFIWETILNNFNIDGMSKMFLSSLPFKPGYQEDASEALLAVLDNFEQDLDDIKKLYYQRIRKRYICEQCEFMHFQKDDYQVIFNIYSNLSNKKTFKHNLISQNDVVHYKCPKCNSTTAKCSSELVYIPEVFFVQFNTKEDKYKYFPLEFDIILTQGKVKYKIAAQVEHYGSAERGHYKGVFQRKDGVFSINDSHVSNGKFAPNNAVYFVMYSRV